jgi:hypothetical protein
LILGWIFFRKNCTPTASVVPSNLVLWTYNTCQHALFCTFSFLMNIWSTEKKSKQTKQNRNWKLSSVSNELNLWINMEKIMEKIENIHFIRYLY